MDNTLANKSFFQESKTTISRSLREFYTMGKSNASPIVALGFIAILLSVIQGIFIESGHILPNSIFGKLNIEDFIKSFFAEALPLLCALFSELIAFSLIYVKDEGVFKRLSGLVSTCAILVISGLVGTLLWWFFSISKIINPISTLEVLSLVINYLIAIVYVLISIIISHGLKENKNRGSWVLRIIITGIFLISLNVIFVNDDYWTILLSSSLISLVAVVCLIYDARSNNSTISEQHYDLLSGSFGLIAVMPVLVSVIYLLAQTEYSTIGFLCDYRFEILASDCKNIGRN